MTIIYLFHSLLPTVTPRVDHPSAALGSIIYKEGKKVLHFFLQNLFRLPQLTPTAYLYAETVLFQIYVVTIKQNQYIYRLSQKKYTQFIA